MKAILSKIMATPNVILGVFILAPLFYFISTFFIGNIGVFLIFLSCIFIPTNRNVLMFELSMPGKREKSIDARYILSLIIIAFYTILIAIVGLGEKGPNQFGFEIFFVMFLLSLIYPVIFLLTEKVHGITIGISAALLVGAVNGSRMIWPEGSIINFVLWIVIGIVLLAVSRTITVKLFLKKGITN